MVLTFGKIPRKNGKRCFTRNLNRVDRRDNMDKVLDAVDSCDFPMSLSSVAIIAFGFADQVTRGKSYGSLDCLVKKGLVDIVCFPVSEKKNLVFYMRKQRDWNLVWSDRRVV